MIYWWWLKMRETSWDKLSWINRHILHLCKLLLSFRCYCLIIKSLFLWCLVCTSILIRYFFSFRIFYFYLNFILFFNLKFSLRFLNYSYYGHMSDFDIGPNNFSKTYSNLSYLFNIWLFQKILYLIFFLIYHLKWLKWTIIGLFLAIYFTSLWIIVIYSYSGRYCFRFTIFIYIILFFLWRGTCFLLLFLDGSFY